jgi:hypothetical protein
MRQNTVEYLGPVFTCLAIAYIIFAAHGQTREV